MSSATSAGAMSRENLCPAFKVRVRLAALPEAAAMFILAWQTAGGELDWSRVLGLLSPGQHGWPAGMAWWCAAMASAMGPAIAPAV